MSCVRQYTDAEAQDRPKWYGGVQVREGVSVV